MLQGTTLPNLMSGPVLWSRVFSSKDTYLSAQLRSRTMTDDAPIECLPNLGPQSGQWLREAGVATTTELERLGPVVAYLLVKQRQPRANLNLLWALAAGLQGKDWRKLTTAIKNRLRQQVDAAKL